MPDEKGYTVMPNKPGRVKHDGRKHLFFIKYTALSRILSKGPLRAASNRLCQADLFIKTVVFRCSLSRHVPCPGPAEELQQGRLPLGFLPGGDQAGCRVRVQGDRPVEVRAIDPGGQ